MVRKRPLLGVIRLSDVRNATLLRWSCQPRMSEFAPKKSKDATLFWYKFDVVCHFLWSGNPQVISPNTVCSKNPRRSALNTRETPWWSVHRYVLYDRMAFLGLHNVQLKKKNTHTHVQTFPGDVSPQKMEIKKMILTHFVLFVSSMFAWISPFMARPRSCGSADQSRGCSASPATLQLAHPNGQGLKGVKSRAKPWEVEVVTIHPD